MSLLVVGSVGLDTVETPHGRVEDVLGGSASFFSAAASYFAPVRLVGVVGEDFPDAHRRFLVARGVDVSGLQTRPGKTFRWSGRYSRDMNDRETLWVELNVFENFEPEIPTRFRSSRHVFLANGSPRTQLSVLAQVEAPEFVLADTMNLWIETAHEELLHLLGRVDGLVVNDAELRQLSDRHNLIRGAHWVLERGPRLVVVKKGEHGAMLVTRDEVVPIPSYPMQDVVDPTGAGDCFAGGLMGFLAADGAVGDEALRRSLVYGTVLASFSIEGFSLDRFRTLQRPEIEERVERFRKILRH